MISSMRLLPWNVKYIIALFRALRENSWKSTPIEGAAGSLVIQQERPPNETVAKSPSIRLFSAFVCPPRFSDLRTPPTSGRGRFGHLLHLVDRSRANPWRKESAYRASSDQVSKAPDPALIVHRQVFDSMIDAYLRRVPSPLLRTNRTQPHRCRGCHPRIGTGRRPHGSESSKDRKCCKTGKRPIKQASRRIPAQSPLNSRDPERVRAPDHQPKPGSGPDDPSIDS